MSDIFHCPVTEATEEAEIDVVSLQPLKASGTKPTIVVQRQSARASKLSIKAHNFEEEFRRSLAAKEKPPLLHVSGSRRRKSPLSTLPSSDGSSADHPTTLKRLLVKNLTNLANQKRAQHNKLERQRSALLRNAFQMLRRCLPDLVHDKSAPKVAILEEAIEFCKVLQQEEARLVRQHDALRKEQVALGWRLRLARQNYTSRV